MPYGMPYVYSTSYALDEFFHSSYSLSLGLLAPRLVSLPQDICSKTDPNKICSLYFLGMLLASCYKTNRVYKIPKTSICISFLPLTVCLMHKGL